VPTSQRLNFSHETFNINEILKLKICTKRKMQVFLSLL